MNIEIGQRDISQGIQGGSELKKEKEIHAFKAS